MQNHFYGSFRTNWYWKTNFTDHIQKRHFIKRTSEDKEENVLKNNAGVKFLSKGDEDDSKNIEDSDKDSDQQSKNSEIEKEDLIEDLRSELPLEERTNGLKLEKNEESWTATSSRPVEKNICVRLLVKSWNISEISKGPSSAIQRVAAQKYSDTGDDYLLI
ncbi:hypothetical protein DAPPUDRAFT_113131 [Daphnia pulex]|uniref:Uncharacterized protein n=1 Tax=Daphnia pulex TaxID=6669 RepID=E9HE58_DAPPU|nr:hypothetical protein DAPPUDRAFT_113131 [Daphnia pulex]|eukprot:EFX69987.1 hypothetical protein DAPPUDRAFT_113131 [Daphnia pulex]